MCFSGFYFYTSLSSILIKNTKDNLDQQINITIENIALSFRILDTTSLNFLSSKNIRAWLSDDLSLADDNYEILQKKIEIESDLRSSMLFNSAWEMGLVTTAYVFINEFSYSTVSRSPVNPEVIAQNNIDIYKKINKTHSLGKLLIPPSLKDKTIYFTRTISNLMNKGESLSLLIGSNENVFYQKYADLVTYPDTLVYIIDNAGTIFSCPDKDLLGKSIDKGILNLKNFKDVKEVSLNNKKYFIASREIGESGLTFIYGIPKNRVMAKLSGSILKFLFIAITIVLIFLMISIFVSFKSTYFIKDLLININKVKSGDYDTKMPSYKDLELDNVSNTFNNMTDEIKFLINQVYEKQLLLKETDIKFLQSQMNPHFLFNVLVTIGIKARMSNDETISKMINSLSELLQAGIYSNGDTKISIRQELEYIKFYLYLQKVRFEDKLEYYINIDNDSILDYYIPRLCIEPIVENAVVHGLEGQSEHGTVTLNIKNLEKSIVFEIIDDGFGFDVDAINFENIINRKKEHNCIGLKNTNRRIKLIYGEEYGIQIDSTVGKGSKVTVLVPMDEGDD